MQPVELTNSLVLLSEGAADKNFLTEIMTRRSNFPRFDAPFPNDDYHGNRAFGQMLMAIRGDRRGFSAVKGVLIVADSGSDPTEIFRNIQTQIGAVGNYPVPQKAEEVVKHTGNNLALAVMLVPNQRTPGGLETLCVAEMSEKTPWAHVCVEKFLRCDKIDASNWSPEKLDKARYHCLVAALNRDDPSKAVSAAFRGHSPLVSVESPAFNNFADRLRSICDNLLS